MSIAVAVNELRLKSVISEGLSENKYDVRPVQIDSGSVAHTASVENVLYHPAAGLQIIDGCYVPIEGIIDPWNLGHFQEQNRGVVLSASRAPFVDADVCIISNMFSRNFTHFTEEMLKVVTLEKAGFTGSFVHKKLPPFGLEYLDALGIDRRRLLRARGEPTVYRSAVYTTNVFFGDISKCPAIFFELRQRLLDASANIKSRCGHRLWLDRGSSSSRIRQDRVVNPEEVDACLDAYGFRHLEIGQLPLLEQVAASSNADVIAGPHGTAFMHCMYMKPESTVIEIFSPHYLNGYSFEICRVLRHRYVMSVHDNADHNPYLYGTDIYVNCGQLRLALQALE